MAVSKQTQLQQDHKDEKKKSTLHKWVEKMAVHLHNEENKRLVQLYLIDPILNHIMDRVFPYIILTCALFSLLVILVGLTFVLLLMKVAPVKFAGVIGTADLNYSAV